MDKPEHTDGTTVPKHTTPTWEMELLVSGGTVFGLIQLSGLVDNGFASLYNRASEDFSFTLMPLWVYVKFVLITLIGTYLVHLCLRGYWVALVGMNSVYPGGVDWGKLRVGPLTRQYLEKNAPSMTTMIENIDNLATRVYSVGFGFATTMLVPVVLAAVSLVLGVAIKRVFDVDNSRWVFGTVFAVVFVPWGIAALVDKHWGYRIREGTMPYRLLNATFAFYERVGIGNSTNPLTAIFNSRGGVKRWGWLSVAVLGITLSVLLSLMSKVLGGLPFEDLPGLPSGGYFAADSVPANFYASQRQAPEGLRPLPYIPDRIAGRPYLVLFVPYLPRKHAPAMQRACPAALAQSEQGKSRAALDCLAKLQDARLDGQPLALYFDASSDPRSGQPGMFAMVPIQRLASGRHELSLLAVNPKREEDGKPPQRYVIPFWK